MKIHSTGNKSGRSREDSTAAFQEVQRLSAELKEAQAEAKRWAVIAKNILEVLNEAEDAAGSGLEWELKDFQKGKRVDREAALESDEDEGEDENEDDENGEGE